MPAGSNRSPPRANFTRRRDSRWIAEFVGDINLFDGQIEPPATDHGAA